MQGLHGLQTVLIYDFLLRSVTVFALHALRSFDAFYESFSHYNSSALRPFTIETIFSYLHVESMFFNSLSYCYSIMVSYRV